MGLRSWFNRNQEGWKEKVRRETVSWQRLEAIEKRLNVLEGQ